MSGQADEEGRAGGWLSEIGGSATPPSRPGAGRPSRREAPPPLARPPRRPEGGRPPRPAGPAGASGRTVTRLAFQAHDQSRVNVFLDDDFAFAMDAVEAVDRGLKVGRVLTAAELAELQQLAERGKAKASALDLLSRRPRSRRELSDRLGRKGFARELVAEVLDDLEQRGYIDDAAFARYWVENRQLNQPRGERALQAELRAKGIETDIIAETVQPTVEDELAAALALARRRAGSLREPDPARFRQRLGAFLQRKGYAYETVRAVVQTVQREQGTAADRHEDDE